MLTAADCRERTKNCRQIAVGVIEPNIRDDLLRVATAWLRLAKCLEREFVRDSLTHLWRRFLSLTILSRAVFPLHGIGRLSAPKLQACSNMSASSSTRCSARWSI
jgi:hypothetical protein